MQADSRTLYGLWGVKKLREKQLPTTGVGSTIIAWNTEAEAPGHDWWVWERRGCLDDQVGVTKGLMRPKPLVRPVWPFPAPMKELQGLKEDWLWTCAREKSFMLYVYVCYCLLLEDQVVAMKLQWGHREVPGEVLPMHLLPSFTMKLVKKL